MSDVTLITCTNAKRDEPAPAKDLYDESGYFRDMRAYAKARGEPWYILSAKHGLVAPDTELDPYDAVGLSDAQATTIATDLAARGYDTAHVTGGATYTDTLIPALKAEGLNVVEVCRGMKIGERRSWLQRRVSELLNENLTA